MFIANNRKERIAGQLMLWPQLVTFALLLFLITTLNITGAQIDWDDDDDPGKYVIILLFSDDEMFFL